MFFFSNDLKQNFKYDLIRSKDMENNRSSLIVLVADHGMADQGICVASLNVAHANRLIFFFVDSK